MHVVHLQLDLFPHKLLTDDSVMEDFDRDCRSGPQWLRAVLAYLDFAAGADSPIPFNAGTVIGSGI